MSSRVNAVVGIDPHRLDAHDFSEDALKMYATVLLRKELAKARLSSSPVVHVQRTSPPTLLLHGTMDTTVRVEQSERLVARLEKMGVPHELVLVESGLHLYH